jgi:hypothetical protein
MYILTGISHLFRGGCGDDDDTWNVNYHPSTTGVRGVLKTSSVKDRDLKCMVGSAVLTEVLMKSSVVWGTTPCSAGFLFRSWRLGY